MRIKKPGSHPWAISWTFWPEHAPEEAPEEPLKKVQLLLVVCFVFATLAGAFFLDNELWQDELYTLEHFVLVPVSTTLTDYHSTNNHIIFNLAANLYLRLLGIHHLKDLLENPLIIRLLPYSFTLFSLPVFYYGIKKSQGALFAFITLSLYISSLQLYTFGAQVRGYSLDLLLSILLLNLILSFHRSSRSSLLPLITITGTLLLINLPSTLYFILSLIALLALTHLSFFTSNNRKLFIASPGFKLALSLGLAVLLASLFFFFKLPQLKGNDLLKASGNSLLQLIQQPVSVIYRLMDWRWLLVIPVVIISLRLRPRWKVNVSIFLAGTLLLPFLFFSFHNPVIVLRIWIILLPVFCLLLAQCFHWIVALKRGLLIPGVAVLVSGTLASLLLLKHQTLRNHSAGFAALDLRYQYHLFRFNPKEVVKKAKEHETNRGVPLMISDHAFGGIRYYLEQYNLYPKDSLPLSGEEVFFISDHLWNQEHPLFPTLYVVDSGKGNNDKFYKWYLLKRALD